MVKAAVLFTSIELIVLELKKNLSTVPRAQILGSAITAMMLE